jgi:copper(I)-binding protein
MLMDLKRPLAKDSTVPVTLRFKDAKGVESQLELVLPVTTTAPAGAASAKSPAKEPAHKH